VNWHILRAFLKKLILQQLFNIAASTSGGARAKKQLFKNFKKKKT
jgi:hypothetical protein